MEVLALIPARGGSKSIPRKNILPLAGKPLLAYSIRHALEAEHKLRPVVSTDDAEIAQVARDYFADVIMRPAELATDTSPDIDTFFHALEYLWRTESYMPQYVVHLRPTCPLRRKGDIDKAIEMLARVPEADSIRSVSRATESIYKQWHIHDGRMFPVYDDDIRHAALMRKLGTTHGKPEYVKYCGEQHSMPRQLLTQTYRQNGYIDVIRSKTILDKRLMAGDVVLPFLVEHKLYELDYPNDIHDAEAAICRERGDVLIQYQHDFLLDGEMMRHAV